jgi:hypothetical protein
VVLGDGALLNVSGGGGFGGCWRSPVGCDQRAATGGGAGGTVIIEAPNVFVAATAVVAGRGGNGAAMYDSMTLGADIGANGAAGTTTGTSNAPAVTCGSAPMLCGTGGVGGTETAVNGTPGLGTAPAKGGGGGGVGHGRIRNQGGAFSPPPGSMKIFFGVDTLGTD